MNKSIISSSLKKVYINSTLIKVVSSQIDVLMAFYWSLMTCHTIKTTVFKGTNGYNKIYGNLVYAHLLVKIWHGWHFLTSYDIAFKDWWL